METGCLGAHQNLGEKPRRRQPFETLANYFENISKKKNENHTDGGKNQVDAHNCGPGARGVTEGQLNIFGRGRLVKKSCGKSGPRHSEGVTNHVRDLYVGSSGFECREGLRDKKSLQGRRRARSEKEGGQKLTPHDESWEITRPPLDRKK